MGLLDGNTHQEYYQSDNHGNYQFTSLDDIITQFEIAYVGEDKIISKIKRADIAFHAQRALQELSFDTFKSTKAQEIVLPPSLQMILPQDYVNYVKLTWSDANGIEHVIYPAIKTSNPTDITQNADGDYTFTTEILDTDDSSSTWDSYNSGPSSENDNDNYWLMNGSRYGLDPQHAQANGSFYIDDLTGKIHFSSNISGKTITLKYISDSLGTDDEMVVHKFAEEAIYKWISYAVLASKANTPEYIVARYKKERRAAIRTTKLRLSNIKLEEITQIFRGKSKQIKH